MIDLGATEFLVRSRPIPRYQFERLSKHLFAEWEDRLGKGLTLPDYSLSLTLEEGSVKGWAKVAAVLGSLYIGVGKYGDFMSGIQTIASQLKSAGDFVAHRAAASAGSRGLRPTIRRSSGALGKLERLFIKVQQRELTVPDAMHEAAELLGDGSADSPEFLNRLEVALQSTSPRQRQLSLAEEYPEEFTDVAEGTRPRRRSPPRKHDLPPPQQLRIEIWRESKNGKRGVRVTEL